MKKVEVAIISTPAIGNLVPAVEFATKLTIHDRRISATILIISMPQRPQVNHYIHSRAAQNTNSNIRFVHIPTVDLPPPDQHHSTIGFLSLFIDKHKPQVKQALQDLTSEPDSVAGLFVDMFCTSMMDVADELSIPCYLFFASPAAFLGFTLHMPNLLEGPPEYSTAEFGNSAGLHELTIPCFANPVPSQVLPSFFRKKNEGGYSSVLCHAHRYRRTKGIVINTFEELEPYAINSLASTNYNGVPLPPVYSVGPLLDHVGRLDGSQHGDIIEWLDDQPPSSVVFLCFGSMGSLKMAQVREIALGLERAGCRFIWSLREPARAKLEFPNDYSDLEAVLPQGFAERTAGIGLVCGWVPQVTVLAHKAVGGFVSHCGWNSILESLWYGVPVATWPLYAEQQMNAFEMVRELDLAVEIRLDCGEGSDLVRAEEVERGVRELMDGGDGVIREKVSKMSDKCREVLMENGSSFVALGKLIQELCCVVSKD